MLKRKDVLVEIKREVDTAKSLFAGLTAPNTQQKQLHKQFVNGLKAAAAVVRSMAKQ